MQGDVRLVAHCLPLRTSDGIRVQDICAKGCREANFLGKAVVRNFPFRRAGSWTLSVKGTSQFHSILIYFHHFCFRLSFGYSWQEPCVKFGPRFPGMEMVKWVRSHDMVEHPERYPELSSASSNKEAPEARGRLGPCGCGVSEDSVTLASLALIGRVGKNS